MPFPYGVVHKRNWTVVPCKKVSADTFARQRTPRPSKTFDCRVGLSRLFRSTFSTRKVSVTIDSSALLRSLSAEKSVSGSELAKKLGVTRAAIWKQIESLRAVGAPIQASAGAGYRLAWPIEPLDESAIRGELDVAMLPRLAGVRVMWQIDSTNTVLLDAAANGAGDVSVLVAEVQTDGRGRRGRQWQSPLGGNVYFSLLRRFDGGMGSLAGLSIVAGIAAVRALRECGVRDIGLKWPNDILAGRKKLAGILVELGGEFLGPCFAVIGIGINVRLPHDAEIDQPFADLSALCAGNAPSRNRIIGRLISQLVASTDTFAATGFAAFEKEYASLDVLARVPVQVHTPSGVQEGIADGVDERGALRVRHGHRVATYDSAEVTVRHS
jgi:BirA family transcriptional regulator, biotin operon repressor / biotin---[acetyl-CoA-carboxylase] ligase